MEKITQVTVKLTRLEVADIITDWLNERHECTFKAENVSISCEDESTANDEFIVQVTA